MLVKLLGFDESIPPYKIIEREFRATILHPYLSLGKSGNSVHTLFLILNISQDFVPYPPITYSSSLLLKQREGFLWEVFGGNSNLIVIGEETELITMKDDTGHSNSLVLCNSSPIK